MSGAGFNLIAVGARPHHANRAHDPTARRALLRPEYMLDASAYPAFGVVRSLLRRRQRVVRRPRR
jgi:hypothetical protein